MTNTNDPLDKLPSDFEGVLEDENGEVVGFMLAADTELTDVEAAEIFDRTFNLLSSEDE